MTKILQIIASADPAGGGPIDGILRQDEAWRAAGLDVQHSLLTLDAPNAPFIKSFPFTVVALGSSSPSLSEKLLAHWGYSKQFSPWLRSNLKYYDLVVVNGLWNYSSFGSSNELPRSRIPYFVFTHGMLDPWFKRKYPLKHFVKQIMWLAGESKLLSHAKSVLFTCEEEKRQAFNQFIGGSYASTVVGYGAVAPEDVTDKLHTAFRSAVPSLSDRNYILYFSRIHPKKGLDLLIEAFGSFAKINKDVDLVVVGPDQTGWTAALQALSRKNGVESRIHWPGPLYGDAKWGGLYGADAFILPSHQENFGIAVAEALACGTPVLISNKVNIWREIEAAGAGIVRPDTVSGTRELLLGWNDIDIAARERMRLAARDLFSTKFNVEHTAPKLVETMESML